MLLFVARCNKRNKYFSKAAKLYSGTDSVRIFELASMAGRVAVVTGANKGIGFAIVRGLCRRFDGHVYLTARDASRGQEAAKALEGEGFKPLFHQLDITDKASVEAFRDYIRERHGGIDVLVNNAAIAFKAAATDPVAVQADVTTRVNYFALLQTCEILFPIMRSGGRVINVSSSAGQINKIPGKSLKEAFLSPTLTVEELSALVRRYVEAAQRGTHLDEGWGNSSYCVSKVAVSALSSIQQKLLADRDIKVNSVHPGYVDTDMTSHTGPLTIDQGAEAPLWLALDAPDSVRGQFVWNDKTISDWRV